MPDPNANNNHHPFLLNLVCIVHSHTNCMLKNGERGSQNTMIFVIFPRGQKTDDTGLLAVRPACIPERALGTHPLARLLDRAGVSQWCSLPILSLCLSLSLAEQHHSEVCIMSTLSLGAPSPKLWGLGLCSNPAHFRCPGTIHHSGLNYIS